MSLLLRITHHDQEWQPKYYGVMVGLFCGLYTITNVLNPKMVDFGWFVLPAGILPFPLCAIITDMLTEIYGFNRTRQAVWTALICTILYAAFTQLAILLPPAAFWPDQAAFAVIFATSPRVALAGCLAWLAGELLNSYVMSKMKIHQQARRPALRFTLSTIVAQAADSLIFMGVAFGGTMPMSQLMTMAVVAWGFKVAYEVVAIPLSLPLTAKMKRLEGVEHFDHQKLVWV
jgi:queuosine precursor transporter